MVTDSNSFSCCKGKSPKLKDEILFRCSGSLTLSLKENISMFSDVSQEVSREIL